MKPSEFKIFISVEIYDETTAVNYQNCYVAEERIVSKLSKISIPNFNSTNWKHEWRLCQHFWSLLVHRIWCCGVEQVAYKGFIVYHGKWYKQSLKICQVLHNPPIPPPSLKKFKLFINGPILLKSETQHFHMFTNTKLCEKVRLRSSFHSIQYCAHLSWKWE